MTDLPLQRRRALLMCAFDHREFFERLVREHAADRFSPFATVALAKELVFEAALDVRERVQAAGPAGLGVFVDEQFGAHVAVRAREAGLVLAMPAERSAAREFSCEFGDRFDAHIQTFDPDLVKVLVRHNPDDDPDLLARQCTRLLQLSDWCRRVGRDLLVELLVPPLPQQQAADFAARQRLPLTLRAVGLLEAAGVRPAVWKVEMPTEPAHLPVLLEACRRDHPDVRVIVLGGGADVTTIVEGITRSAAAGYDGFAVGRTIWAEPLSAWLSGRVSREEARSQMARHYEDCVTAFRNGAALDAIGVPA